MRTLGAFTISLVVAFIVLSALVDRGRTQGVVTGTVVAYDAGTSISVTNDTTNPTGFPIALGEATAYEGDPAGLEPGVRVTVLYSSVAERRPVADIVRVLGTP
jgi:hypothetical protein